MKKQVQRPLANSSLHIQEKKKRKHETALDKYLVGILTKGKGLSIVTVLSKNYHGIELRSNVPHETLQENKFIFHLQTT